MGRSTWAVIGARGTGQIGAIGTTFSFAPSRQDNKKSEGSAMNFRQLPAQKDGASFLPEKYHAHLGRLDPTLVRRADLVPAIDKTLHPVLDGAAQLDFAAGQSKTRASAAPSPRKGCKTYALF
jgi:hypothetical protein